MSTNCVIEAIAAAFKLEIANQFMVAHDTLTLTLPDQSLLKIQAVPVTPGSTTHIAPPIPRDQHTFHYVHQHDFTSGDQPSEKLQLHNLAECRAYLDDVCLTFLNAHLHDSEIQFSDHTAYLITCEPCQ